MKTLHETSRTTRRSSGNPHETARLIIGIATHLRTLHAENQLFIERNSDHRAAATELIGEEPSMYPGGRALINTLISLMNLGRISIASDEEFAWLMSEAEAFAQALETVYARMSTEWPIMPEPFKMDRFEHHARRYQHLARVLPHHHGRTRGSSRGI